jgi:omega-hydroxy-beta-dihydromenaquinone-9 sulfotransferase
LGDFAHVRDTLTQWAETAHREYKTNQHELPAEQEAMIRERWSDYFARYGY